MQFEKRIRLNHIEGKFKKSRKGRRKNCTEDYRTRYLFIYNKTRIS